MRTLTDIGRLIIFILLLPIGLILIGPLLVLAVVRGQQRMGPIVLNSARYDLFGRIGILMLGLAIWLMVWSGLLWFGLLATSPSMGVRVPFISSDSFNPVREVMSTVTAPVASPVVDTTTAAPSMTLTTHPDPLPAASATTDSTSPPATPVARHTATPVSVDPTPETSPVPPSTARTSPTATAGLASVGRSSLPVVDEEAVIATIKEANLLLQEAITLPSEENLANLGVIWQDRALTKVVKFANMQYERYRKPFRAQFEFISSPTIREQRTDEIIITSQERWSYGRTSNIDQESFEFIYTVIQEDNRWVITHYSYRNLVSPTPTVVLQNGTVVTTPTVQN